MIPEHVGLRQIVQDLRDQPVERIREALVGSALPHELEQAVAHSRAQERPDLKKEVELGLELTGDLGPAMENRWQLRRLLLEHLGLLGVKA